MGAPAKFLFDTDFSANRAKERTITTAELVEQTEKAEARGYRSGFDAGQNEATIENGRRLSYALEQIGRSIGELASQFLNAKARIEIEAVDIAVAVAKKLCTELIAAEPLTEATALINECFRQLTSTPHIVVRINDELYDGARPHIERLAKQSGFEGRLVILAEPDIPGGDCKIEWADGGVTLDRATTEAKIDELVGRYMVSRNQAVAETTIEEAEL